MLGLLLCTVILHFLFYSSFPDWPPGKNRSMSLYITEPVVHQTTKTVLDMVCNNNDPLAEELGAHTGSAQKGRDLSQIRLLIAVKTAAAYMARRDVNRDTWMKLVVRISKVLY